MRTILFLLATTATFANSGKFAYADSIAVTPDYLQMISGQSAQFTASDRKIVWEVDNVAGGTATSGTITQQGLYTVPAKLPRPAAATITAVSASDPTQRVSAVVTLLQAAPSGSTYYVSPGGSDSAPGTKNAPWRTIQHAANLATAGDTVLVRQGTYNELVTPAASGNAAKGPITFSSYPGEVATVDGTGLPIPGGQAGLFTLNGVGNVIVHGFELRNYTTATRSHVPVGLYITGAGDGVQIVGNHIHDITTTAKTTPNACASNALGMAVYGNKVPAGITGLVVAGNEIDHLQTGCSESMSLDGNVQYFLVGANIVHDNDNIGIDAIGFERVAKNPAYDQARDGEIRGNTVYNVTSYGNPDYGRQYAADGIYVDGGTRITIEQNLVYNVDLGIELASEHKGRLTSYITARNNIVTADNSNGISIGGYARNRGGSDHVTVVNNTLYGNDTKNTGSGELQIQWNATNNVFANNIAYATGQGLFLHNYPKIPTIPATLDYDLYFGSTGAAKGVWQWEGVRHVGFSTYVSASGQDIQSAFADPLFRNPTNGDFRLQAGSPAINAGNDLGSDVVGIADFAGAPRVANSHIDVGAFEVQ